MNKIIILVALFFCAELSNAQQNKVKKKTTKKQISKSTVVKNNTIAKMDSNEITTASGIKIKITEKGKGRKVMQGNKVVVHYTGTLLNGKKFDSSRDRNQPLSFKVGIGQVIRGWDEAFQLLNIGDKAILTIPPALCYGEQAMGDAIPANSTLVFDVEVIDAIEAPMPKPAVPFNVAGLDTITMQSGLKFIKVESGSGVKAQQGKYVSVHYTGYLMDGKKFDSSVERGEPLEFQLGRGMVIPGWEEGIELMFVGDKTRFIIPSELAYGERGAAGAIPPNATLIFDCELVDVQ